MDGCVHILGVVERGEDLPRAIHAARRAFPAIMRGIWPGALAPDQAVQRG
jgi:hypothetical protein